MFLKPLFSFLLLLFFLFGLLIHLRLLLQLQKLHFLVLNGLFQKFASFSFWNQLLGSEVVPVLDLDCLLNCSREVLDVFDFFLVLAFYFFHNFEGPVFFTINTEDFFFVAHVVLFIKIHAIIGTFGAFDVEVDLAVRFAAFNTSTYIAALFTADDTSMCKFGEVQLVHLYWGLRSNNWSLHPHRAAVMDPMIESISHRSIWCLQQHLVPAYEPAVIFRRIVILFLMLVEIQLVVCYVFLSLDRFAHFRKFWNRIAFSFTFTFLIVLFDFQQLLIEFLEQLLFVALLSKEQLVQTGVVLVSPGCLLLIDLVLL